MTLNKIKLPFLLMVFVSFVSVGFVNAHGTGESFEKSMDGYKVDIGYEPVVFKSQQVQRFDFDLYDSKTNKDVEFTDVWVNISQGNKTVFASGIYKSDFGVAGMTYVFPDKGEYILDVRYEKNGESIVQTTFPISVLESDVVSGSRSNSLLLSSKVVYVFGFLIICFVTYFIFKRFKRTEYL